MKTLAFFFVLIVPAFARLGETEAECVIRYGSNLSTIGGEGRFEKNGIGIQVTFKDGTAERVHFHRLSDKLLGEPLTDAQIKELLKANLGASTRWQSLEKDSVGERFTREDSTAFAYWNFASGTLELITAKVKRREDDERSAQRAKDLAEKMRQAESLKRSTEGF